MPTYYDEYESTTRHGYGADPRGLGAAASCYAPPMGQRVNLYGRQYFPVVKRAGERVLVRRKYTTQRQRSQTIKGPVRGPGGMVYVIPKRNPGHAYTPNTQRQGRAVQQFIAQHGGRPGSRGRSGSRPRNGGGRGRSASVGSQRSHKSGRRGSSVGSQRSHKGGGRQGKGGEQGQRGAAKGVHLNPNDPIMAPANEAQKIIKGLKKDETVHVTEEVRHKIQQQNEKVLDLVKERKGRFKFLPVAAQRDVQAIDTGEIEGKTKGEAQKVVIQFRRKQIKILKTAKKSFDNHEKKKSTKEVLYEENTGQKYTDDTVWEEAAFTIASKHSIKVKGLAHFELILPYVIFEKFMKVSEPESSAAKEEHKARLHRVLTPRIIAWLSSSTPFEGFDPAKDFIGTRNWTEALDHAIVEALRIRSVAKILKDKLAADFHADGDFDLHVALHAHLLMSGVEVLASPYPTLQAAPAAAADASAPARYVSMVRF